MEKCYVIKDTQGRFEGHINIVSNSDTGKGNYVWDYYSKAFPTSWSTVRENAELKLNRLRELNSLSEYPLDWEVVEFTEQEILEQFEKSKELGFSNSTIESKEIQKGYVGRQRKVVNDIYRRYKFMEKRRIA